MKALKFSKSLLIATIALVSCNKEDDTISTTPTIPIEQKNAQVVTDALTKMYDQLDTSLIDTYYHPLLKNHSVDATIDFTDFTNSIVEMAAQNITIVREIFKVIAQDDLVLVQSKVTIGNNNAMAVCNLFRILDNKIVEQWNIKQEEPNPVISLANGNTMFDGGGDATKIMSSMELERNKQTIRDFIHKGFVQGDSVVLNSLFGMDYIQHNPQIPNGKEVILGFIENGGFPAKIERIGAQGDLVFILADYSDSFGSYIVDIFRLDDNGKVVEHWDVIEATSTSTDFFAKGK